MVCFSQIQIIAVRLGTLLSIDTICNCIPMTLRKVAVIGAGSTSYGKFTMTARDLALLASKEAIERAEVEPKDIQGAFIANAFGLAEKQGHLGPLIMSGLGIPDVPASTIESACSSGASAFREAYILSLIHI